VPPYRGRDVFANRIRKSSSRRLLYASVKLAWSFARFAAVEAGHRQSGLLPVEDPPTAPFEESIRTAIRVELSGVDAAFPAALELAAGEDLSTKDVVERTLARIRQRDATRIGRLGERVARARQRKRRIPSLSGTARFRVPDILTEVELIEVKNVRRLALTSQLLDFAEYAQAQGLSFVLVTRFDTVLAPDLAALVASGRIEHREFAGLLSANGRRFIRQLINDELAGDRTRRGE
jgi:hypothetical protein